MSDVVKQFALMEEMDTSSRLIKLGFGELQNIDGSNDFHFLPLQLLSQGFERFMKSFICLGHFHATGTYPSISDLKYLGHDLEKLLSEILCKHFHAHSTPLLREDREFLERNDGLKKLLYILSEFGKLARYHNFDIITGNAKPSINAKAEWREFETEILLADEAAMAKVLDYQLNHEVRSKISRHIIMILEKFVGSLSRQILHNGIGQDAKQLSSPCYDFGRLDGRDPGVTDYRKHTTRYRVTPRRRRKRTIIDFLQRKYNKAFAHRVLCKEEYNGDWPFYANEVVIECRHRNWCVITIYGCDYALNGLAAGRYKLDNPFEGGVAMIGKSLSDFTTMALELGKK